MLTKFLEEQTLEMTVMRSLIKNLWERQAFKATVKTARGAPTAHQNAWV